LAFAIEQEHRPWCPAGYAGGIKGQRIAICGHSHKSHEGFGPDLTNEILERVVTGEVSAPFFTKIMTAFGYKSPRHFWPKVLFFNFIPTCVDPFHRRTEAGATAGQINQGRTRLLRLLDEHSPQKLLVFSGKVTWATPNISYEDRGATPTGHGQTYPTSSDSVRVFYHREPKRAPQNKLNEFVQRCMAAR
jgi:hypothetical protein